MKAIAFLDEFDCASNKHRFSRDKKNNVSTCRADVIDRLFIMPFRAIEINKEIKPQQHVVISELVKVV